MANALGRSRGGFSTKIHAVVTAKGKPLHVQLTPGQKNEALVARDLLEYARGRFFMGDASYDSNELIDACREQGMKPVIHPRASRKVFRAKLDRKRYATRYLVEVFFHKLKRFRAVATRYDKSARSYLAMVQVACLMVSLASI